MEQAPNADHPPSTATWQMDECGHEIVQIYIYTCTVRRNTKPNWAKESSSPWSVDLDAESAALAPIRTRMMKTMCIDCVETVFSHTKKKSQGQTLGRIKNLRGGVHSLVNKLAKLRRHASWVHFAKIHFGEIHFGKIHLKKYTLEKINFGGIHFDDCCTEGQPEIGNPKV